MIAEDLSKESNIWYNLMNNLLGLKTVHNC